MKCPEEISKVQPKEDSKLLRTESQAVFKLWSAARSERFLRDWAPEMSGRNVYPLGTFPNGDVVCWEDDYVAVVVHDSEDMRPQRVRMKFTNFLKRILALDEKLEDEIFSGELGW
jgi:hypothetical protein